MDEQIMIENKKKYCKYLLKSIEMTSSVSSAKEKIRLFNTIPDFSINDDVIKKQFRRAFKMILKELYAKESDYHFFDHAPKLINQGLHVIDKDYSDSWYYWYIFEANSIEEVIEQIEEYGKGYIYIESDDINSPYDCTGQVFSHGMDIRKVGKNRYLATKRYAIDV